MARTPDYNEIFAANVRTAMAAEDPPLSQPVLAARSHMHQRTLGRIINGEVTPTLDKMGKIANGLNRSLWQLLVPNMDPANLPMLAPATEEERRLWESIQLYRKSPPPS